MIGAIFGDIVGSRFEWNNIKTKDFQLFVPECSFTDDSVMTIAIGLAVSCLTQIPITDLPSVTQQTMRMLGHQYPNRDYGGAFRQWLQASNPQPYNSWGNGAAMRVSVCGHAAATREQVKQLSHAVTAVTHNHPEGLKGAEATAMAIFMARHGHSQQEIRNYISQHYYPLNFTLADIRGDYRFDASCQGTVPQAIQAFCEATDFEDAIRNAISIGGDSDTVAAITGSIAEPFFGIPIDLEQQARDYLDSTLLAYMEQIDDFLATDTPISFT